MSTTLVRKTTSADSTHSRTGTSAVDPSPNRVRYFLIVFFKELVSQTIAQLAVLPTKSKTASSRWDAQCMLPRQHVQMDSSASVTSRMLSKDTVARCRRSVLTVRSTSSTSRLECLDLAQSVTSSPVQLDSSVCRSLTELWDTVASEFRNYESETYQKFRGTPQLIATDGCPPGEIVYMERNEVVACDPFNPHNQGCPTTFSCQWSIRTQRYQCCGSDPLPTPMESESSSCDNFAIWFSDDGCPTRQIAYTDPDTKKPKICTSASHSCPAGYFCQFSNQNKQFQCCGMPSDCPIQMVAFIGITGEAQACSMNGGSACPEGFSCVRGKSGFELCCAGGESEFNKTSCLFNCSVSACEASQVPVNGVCMNRVIIGEQCEETPQCVGGAHCIAMKCLCPTGTIEQKQQCVEFTEKELSEGNLRVWTYLLIAECTEKQVKIADECFPLVTLGRSCVHSGQCQGMGQCIEGVCDCEEQSVRKGSRCEKKPASRPQQTSTPLNVNRIATNSPHVLKQIQPPMTTTSTTAATSSWQPQPGHAEIMNEGICPAPRQPYLANGIARQCISGQPCPVGYSCTWSPQAKNYFCCAANKLVMRTHGKVVCLPVSLFSDSFQYSRTSVTEAKPCCSRPLKPQWSARDSRHALRDITVDARRKRNKHTAARRDSHWICRATSFRSKRSLLRSQSLSEW